jgi:coenzyme F420-0:L-glutamate ligase/coenzyme F420-1:gamma-L-glutamate ligase
VTAGALHLTPLEGFPAVRAGDELAELIVACVRRQLLRAGDSVPVLVVAQKVVSKAEGRLVFLRDVEVTDDARRLAEETSKDPRVVELILRESQSVIRVRPGLIIAEHRTGHILANAGIDASNTGVDAVSGDEAVLLWPENPDASARALSEAVSQALGYHVPVVINDSLGRPWRMGTVGFAIGVAGLEPVWDQVGERDLDGRTMQVTAPAMADALAAAASLVQGETDQGAPVVWVEGCPLRVSEQASSRELLRAVQQDMFR